MCLSPEQRLKSGCQGRSAFHLEARPRCKCSLPSRGDMYHEARRCSRGRFPSAMPRLSEGGAQALSRSCQRPLPLLHGGGAP